MVTERFQAVALTGGALVLALVACQCRAQGVKTDESGGSRPTESQLIEFQPDFTAFLAQEEPAIITIKLLDKPTGWELKVKEKGPDICPQPEADFPVCEGRRFLWVISGHELEEGQEVRIENRETTSTCFPWSTLPIGPNQAGDSGTAQCDGGKHGILWPYDVRFLIRDDLGEWVEMAAVDPRGIIH